MTWTLITVTYGGDVGHSRGYPSKYLCEQAKSLAVTGMTIEQKKAADDDAAMWKQKRADAWRAAHPLRKPVTKDDFKLVESTKKGCVTWGSTGEYSTYNTEDGLIYDWPGSGGGFSVYSEPPRDAIKYAECVLTEMPAAEAA